jgi:ubiquinone/menaquinone biosynthesis C-methylase UbiE
MPETKHTREATFSSYKKDESKQYAQVRMAYHPSVYETAIAHHTATGGHLDSLLDVGCGPGLATRDLAAHFKHVTGIDAGESMIEVARSMNIQTSSSEPVRFELTTAEEMAGIPDASIDLITAANAAHWFDMPAFWARAAQVLKPSGSVAMWSSGEPAAHPDTPNAAAINEAFKRYQKDYLEPYFEPGNRLTRDGYRSLPMPWDATPPIESFARDGLFRKDWALDEPFHVGQDDPISLDLLEKMLATSSPVTRWRQAHPETQGTEGDVVRVLRNEIEKLLGEAGVAKGAKALKGAAPGVLVMVRKS